MNRTRLFRKLSIPVGLIALTAAMVAWSPASSSATVDPSGQNPPGSLPGYTRQYVDEFTGTALNGNDWTAYNNPNSTKPQGPKVAQNAIVKNGRLKLRVTKVNGVWMGAGVYSKVVHTTYGRVILRAKYDHGYGAKGVALMWPESHPWPPEIDFFEVGTDTNHSKEWMTNHYDTDNKQQHNYVGAAPGWHVYVIPNFDTSQWHTYDMQWTPDAITYRVDGTVVATQSGHAPNIRMWLGMQNSLGRTADTKPNSTTPWKVDLTIDWVDFLTPTS